MEESKNITIRFKNKVLKAIDQMIEDTGAESISEIVRRCIINEYYRIYKVMPDGVVAERKMTKKDREENLQESLCRKMDGEVIDKGGIKMCRYAVYEMINPKHVEKYEQEIPVKEISESTVAGQYNPNKADCLKILSGK
jgi:hypothetical protein